jgi:hypothetical protein
MNDLESLLKRLVDHRVEFVIVGGYAAVAHGVSLVTRDVDVCCRFTPKNLLHLQEAIADLHPIHRMTPLKLPLQLTAKNCRGLKNLYLKTDLGAVGGFTTVLRQSIMVDLGFGQCRILDIDALIKAKEAMDRPRDRETVLQLRAIKLQHGRRKRG